MKVLVFGQSGQLARCLAESQPETVEASYLSRQEADFSDANTPFAKLVQDFEPDLVVNATAYTAVDKAEDDADTAFAVNSDALAALGQACVAQGCPIIHISTDYVFDGRQQDAYLETDRVGPQGVYGASKLSGELALLGTGAQAYIFRTAWVYSAFGNNFVKTMLRLGAERDSLGIVGDQVGCPTSAHELAEALWKIIPQCLTGKANRGLYHLTAPDTGSWYDLAQHVFETAASKGVKTPSEVKAIATSDYPTPASRPAFSILSTAKTEATFDVRLSPWRDEAARIVHRLIDEQA